jgi:polysaccharide biosynthesis protein PslG
MKILGFWALGLALAACSGSTSSSAPNKHDGGSEAADSGRDARSDATDSGADVADAADASPVACTRDGDCAAGELCASNRVDEISYEPDDHPVCTPASDVIGQAPPSWKWQAGGRPLTARLCVAGGLDTGASSAAAARRAREEQLLQAAGVTTVRVDLTWSAIEPAKGTFDYSAYDPMVDAARSAGLDVIGIVDYGVPWATTQTTTNDKYPPDDPADYGDYAAALATHYAGRIHRFELWNEPNIGLRFMLPTVNGDPAKYADLMTAGATAIHQACPTCTVYSAGLSFHQQVVVNGAVEFVSDMLSARPHAFDGSVDAFGFHAYPLYPPSVGPEVEGNGERSISGMIDDLHAVLALRKAPALPFALTEVGWPTSTYSNVDDATQARFTARETLLAASLGADPVCLFTLSDGANHGSYPPEDDFGLYNYDSADPASVISPKAARDALAWIARLGANAAPDGGSQSVAQSDPSHGQFALDFGSGSARWTALWRTGAAGSVHLAGETRSAYDLDGNLIASPAGGALDVTVSDAPIYLVASPPP